MIAIQARSGSKRFPGKCFAKFDGVPLIAHIYEAMSKLVPSVVLVPDNDHKLIEFCHDNEIKYSTGPEHHVLKRYYDFCKKLKWGALIRITGDCPAINLLEVDRVLRWHNCDYVTNCYTPQVDGWEVELLSMRALEWLMKKVRTVHDKEHVTTYLKRGNNLRKFEQDGFSYQILPCPVLASVMPKLSIDTKKDLKRVERYYKELCKQNKY